MSKPSDTSMLLLLKLVDEMRRAQKSYLLTRSADALDKAKSLERRVDYHLEQTFIKHGYPIGSLPTKSNNQL